jgi:Ca2+-binding EF-hand superfamily protein
MDIDKDKQISRKEFKKCCDLMQVPLKDADIEMVFTFLDVNDDGEITYSEFLEFERLQKQRNNVGKIQVIEGLRNANDKKRLDNICVFLASKLKEKFKTVEKSFQHFDTDKHYRLTRKEFLAGLEKLKFSVTKSDIESVF